MLSVTASEFAKNFGEYREAAQREPVAITSYGRTTGFFVSAVEFAELQRLRAMERRAYSLSELPADVANQIETAKMDPAHSHLDALLDT